MTQTAALSTRQPLHISSQTTTLSEVTHTNVDAGPLLKESSLYSQTPLFFYKERVHLKFQVKTVYAPHFILVKGLLEFHRPKDFRFVFNVDEKSFEIDIKVSQLGFLEVFLDKIYTWLNRELAFKSVLKQVVAFEKRYKTESEKLYNAQKAIVASTGTL